MLIIALNLLLVSFFAHADPCLIPISKRPLPASCNDKKPVFIRDIPQRVLNWGSGGRGGMPWRFIDPACNDFFVTLMRAISEYNPDIKLTPHDLFHAHMLKYNTSTDLALVFHAKEYPADLEIVKNTYQDIKDIFYSTDLSYERRNFIYFTHDTAFAQAHILYLVTNSGTCKRWFEPAGFNYLSEELLSHDLSQGALWGDFNIFMPESLKNIAYNFNEHEKFYTAKDMISRLHANYNFYNWLKKNNNKPLFYMLTGAFSNIDIKRELS
jgi:hypothetical protein